MSDTIVGTCGNCGGPVSVPAFWYGINNPTPTCCNCGSSAKEDFGPVLPMRPRPNRDIVPATKPPKIRSRRTSNG